MCISKKELIEWMKDLDDNAEIMIGCYGGRGELDREDVHVDLEDQVLVLGSFI